MIYEIGILFHICPFYNSSGTCKPVVQYKVTGFMKDLIGYLKNSPPAQNNEVSTFSLIIKNNYSLFV